MGFYRNTQPKFDQLHLNLQLNLHLTRPQIPKLPKLFLKYLHLLKCHLFHNERIWSYFQQKHHNTSKNTCVTRYFNTKTHKILSNKIGSLVVVGAARLICKIRRIGIIYNFFLACRFFCLYKYTKLNIRSFFILISARVFLDGKRQG